MESHFGSLKIFSDQELSRRPALSHQDLEDLFAQAEAEEVTERQRQEDSENEEPEPLSENDSKEDPYRETPKIVELDDKPVSSTPSPQLIEPTSPQPALKSILSNPKLDSDTNYSSREPPRRKSVRLDVEGPQPEAEPSPPKPIRPLPSTSAPVKSSVVERPFQQSVKANVVERLRTSEETKSPHPKSFADANGTNSVDSDDDSDVDWNEWDSDGSEEDDWDALMLQRELAMQYHAKRYDLGAGMGTGALGGTGDSAAWQLGNQDVRLTVLLQTVPLTNLPTVCSRGHLSGHRTAYGFSSITICWRSHAERSIGRPRPTSTSRSGSW